MLQRSDDVKFLGQMAKHFGLCKSWGFSYIFWLCIYIYILSFLIHVYHVIYSNALLVGYVLMQGFAAMTAMIRRHTTCFFMSIHMTHTLIYVFCIMYISFFINIVFTCLYFQKERAGDILLNKKNHRFVCSPASWRGQAPCAGFFEIIIQIHISRVSTSLHFGACLKSVAGSKYSSSFY